MRSPDWLGRECTTGVASFGDQTDRAPDLNAMGHRVSSAVTIHAMNRDNICFIPRLPQEPESSWSAKPAPASRQNTECSPQNIATVPGQAGVLSCLYVPYLLCAQNPQKQSSSAPIFVPARQKKLPSYRPKSYMMGKLFKIICMLAAWLGCGEAAQKSISSDFTSGCQHPPYTVSIVSKSPMVLYLHDFITREERLHLQEVT